MTIDMPIGEIGDVEAALRKSGFGVLESTEMAQHIVASAGIGFRTNDLSKAGIDVGTLARELRANGLVVRWTGEIGPAV